MPSISASDVAIGLMPGLVDLGRTISNAWVEKQQVGERRRQFDTGQRENVRQFDDTMTFNRRKTALDEANVGPRPSRAGGGGAGGGASGSLRDPFAAGGGDVPTSKPFVDDKGAVVPGLTVPMSQAERLVAAQQARHSNLADALENAGMTDAAMEQRKYALSADTSDLTKWVSESSALFQRGRSLLDSGGSVVGGRPSSASRAADPIATLSEASKIEQYLKYGTVPDQGTDPRLARPMPAPAPAQEPLARPAPAPAPERTSFDLVPLADPRTMEDVIRGPVKAAPTMTRPERPIDTLDRSNIDRAVQTVVPMMGDPATASKAIAAALVEYNLKPGSPQYNLFKQAVMAEVARANAR
jgi:hypothetical protein